MSQLKRVQEVEFIYETHSYAHPHTKGRWLMIALLNPRISWEGCTVVVIQQRLRRCVKETTDTLRYRQRL